MLFSMFYGRKKWRVLEAMLQRPRGGGDSHGDEMAG